MNVFWGMLESAYLCVCLCASMCLSMYKIHALVSVGCCWGYSFTISDSSSFVCKPSTIQPYYHTTLSMNVPDKESFLKHFRNGEDAGNHNFSSHNLTNLSNTNPTS